MTGKNIAIYAMILNYGTCKMEPLNWIIRYKKKILRQKEIKECVWYNKNNVLWPCNVNLSFKRERIKEGEVMMW